MPDRISGSIITVALAGVAVAALSVPLAMAQAPAKSSAAQGSAVKTPWGEPDLQGIWTDETDTPLQRSPKYARQEFFTATQREELDREPRLRRSASATYQRPRYGGFHIR